MNLNQQNNQTNHLLFFMHIPKTGGITLLDIIRNQYGAERVITRGQPEIVRKINPQIIKCVQGHHPFGLHQYWQKPYTYITMLRDPVNRVISHYYYLLRKIEHPLHTTVKNMSLEEFITSKHFGCRRLVRNMQTQIASGANRPAGADLKKAKQNLSKHFRVIGITERYNESLFLMKKGLGWDEISYEKQNVTANRPAKKLIPEHIIKKIRQFNRLDSDLYKWAKEKFEEKLRELDPKEKEELKEFINRIH